MIPGYPKSFLFAVTLAGLALWPQPAWAYIGPGAGFAVATSFIYAVLTAVISLLGLLFWPVRKTVKWWKRRKFGRIDPYFTDKKKVIILGFDGMDYSLTRKYLAEGKLPNLAKLAESGTFAPLLSTSPPESPVAWASFITGCNPGKHNIFDFLARDPKSYLPQLSIAEVKPPKRTFSLGKFVIPLSQPKVEGRRKGVPFWHHLADRGINSTVLRVPVTFPPEKFDGLLLSSMGVPDILGSQGTHSFYTTAPQGKGAGEEVGYGEGGVVTRLEKTGGKISSFIRGPRNSMLKSEPPSKIRFELHPENNGTGAAIIFEPGTAELDGDEISTMQLKTGEYSPWVTLKFGMSLGVTVTGICRLCLISVSPETALYITPINIDPEKPAVPLSHPPVYSRYLALANGQYSTLGLAEDTWALNNGAITQELFLRQSTDILDEREKMFFSEFEKNRHGCIVTVFDTTDRVQHMFWRFTDEAHPRYGDGDSRNYGDAILDVYKRMDRIAGRVMETAGPDTAIYILSDHGFKPFGFGMNVNTWLMKEGYLALKENTPEGGKFFRGVDWSRTKAYSIGLSGIYLNIKGRERNGVVEPAEAEKLAREIIAKLIALTHSAPGGETVKPFCRADYSKDIYTGEFAGNAPDIVLGFNEGYRVSWRTTLGAAPQGEVFEPNNANWSGDHCLAPERVPGIFMSTRRVELERSGVVFDNTRGVSIMDLGPTVLAEFGITSAGDFDGKQLIPTAKAEGAAQ